jgi:dGTPase
MTAKARRVIQDLFGAFVADPRLLPPQYQPWPPRERIERATADYIAGMTDRYSMKEHRRLFAVSEFLRVVAALQRIEIHRFWRYI